MHLFCDIETLKEALKSCAELLQEEDLKKRGLQDFFEGIETTRNFLNYIIDNIQRGVSSYEELINTLQSVQLPREYSQLAGLMGKLLDAVQISKPSTVRNFKVRKSIPDALRRTGHELLWEELEEREKYEEELTKATATCQLLEVASLIESSQSRNPINTLRNSMGARLPEEYFAELLAGWLIEDVFKKNLESKEFDCSLEGPDRERKIQFIRPTEMGLYDFKASKSGNVFYLELQRTAKLSRERQTNKIKTYLKKHKYEGADSDNKILILWVGKPSQQAYRKWIQKLVFIANIPNKDNVVFKDKEQNICLPEEIFDAALTWEDFKSKSGNQVVGLFRDA